MIDEGMEILDGNFFDYLVRLEVNRATRYQNFVTLLLMEPDQELASDNAMDPFSKILRKGFRGTDIVGRVNHMQFRVILVNSDLRDSCLVGERIRGQIEKYSFGKGREITVSLGGACFPSNVTSCQDLISLAERMLKLAKEKGGNVVCFPSKKEGP